MRQVKKDKPLDESLKESQNKNSMIFRILCHVPEFKKDVVDIRMRMGIRAGGFDFPKINGTKGYEKNDLTKWADKNKFRYYILNDQVNDFPSNYFEKEMLKLGSKYKLPSIFYIIPGKGLPRFVLTGDMIIQSPNYKIDIRTKDKNLLYTSLIAYAPLSKHELKEAILKLSDAQLNFLPNFFKVNTLFAKKEYRNNISRDLLILGEQVNRTGKPKKIEQFESGSYLDYLNKSKDVKPKTLRRQKRIDKKNIKIKYDQPTSKEIGKKVGISADATRQAKRRLNKLSKELFGYNLEP